MSLHSLAFKSPSSNPFLLSILAPLIMQSVVSSKVSNVTLNVSKVVISVTVVDSPIYDCKVFRLRRSGLQLLRSGVL